MVYICYTFSYKRHFPVSVLINAKPRASNIGSSKSSSFVESCHMFYRKMKRFRWSSSCRVPLLALSLGTLHCWVGHSEVNPVRLESTPAHPLFRFPNRGAYGLDSYKLNCTRLIKANTHCYSDLICPFFWGGGELIAPPLRVPSW